MENKDKLTIKPYGGRKNNNISNFLLEIAVIIWIAGFTIGVVFGNLEVEDVSNQVENSFQWSVAILYWLISGVSGLILFGLAEVIRIMQLHQTQSYIVTSFDESKDEYNE